MTGPSPQLPPSLRPFLIAIAGMASLGVAMGIGRFAFTPLLPLMMADGSLGLAAAGWLASANYLGYLVGALACTFQPWLWRKLGRRAAASGPALVRAGLVATVLLTLGMAAPWPAAWAWLRFAAGVASAVVFIHTSGWCLGQLARLQLPAMGALIYMGPGVGILASGLAASAIVAGDGSASLGWAVFGVLAALLTAAVWSVFHPAAELPPPAPPSPGQPPPVRARRSAELPLFALAYGLAGFGYIISATFLPVIARQALPGSPWLDLFWPLVGLGVIAGALLASRTRVTGDLRLLLAGSYLMQAMGVAASLVSPTLAGFAVGSLLLGIPLTSITYFAMQEVRRLRPRHAPTTIGLVTAVYGVGQIAGPPLAAELVARSSTAGAGFSLSLAIAAGSLLLGAVVYVVMTRRYPLGGAQGS